MIYTIDQQIFEMFPRYCRGVVVARNIDNTKLNPEMASLLGNGSERIASDPSINVESHPRLTVWSNAYRRFGANPVKETPSICFLVKHVKSGKLIRSISPVVDVFNLFSLKLLIPCGGDDLDAVGDGDLRLGVAEGDEQFSPLFKPQATEKPKPGEVIYFTPQTKRVLCRRWNWRNADFSKILPATTSVAINLDGMTPEISRSELEGSTAELGELLKRHCGGTVTTGILDALQPTFEL